MEIEIEPFGVNSLTGYSQMLVFICDYFGLYNQCKLIEFSEYRRDLIKKLKDYNMIT